MNPCPGFRLLIAHEARIIGKHPSELQLKDLTMKRNRLQRQIAKFQTEAQKRLPDKLITEAGFHDLDYGEWYTVDNEDHQTADDPVVHPLPPGAENLPEHLAISLPSTVTPEEEDEAFNALCLKEQQLRVGQANDALHRVRLGIANRSVMLRTTMRDQREQRVVTRNWGKVHRLAHSATRAARVYELARKALLRLGAPDNVMAPYKVLTSADLKAETAKFDFNSLGSRNVGASWLWGMHEDSANENVMLAGASPALQSCEY